MIILVPGLGMPDLGLSSVGYYHADAIEDFDCYQQDLSSELRRIRRIPSVHKIHVVGFSLGADAVVRLGETWDERGGQTHLDRVTLIDPNLGLETMFLSQIFANDAFSDLAQLRQVMRQVTDVAEFFDVVDYLSRLLPLHTVQAVARQAVAWWGQPGASLPNRVGRLVRYATTVDVHMSRDYLGADLPPGVAMHRYPKFGHFDMIRPENLRGIIHS